MTKINSKVVHRGKLQHCLSKMPMIWIFMSGNPSVWFGFVWWGESHPLDDVQPGIREANRQDLDVVILSPVVSSPSHESSSHLSDLFSPPATWCWGGRIKTAFPPSYLYWRGSLFLSTSKTSVLAFHFGVIVQNNWDFMNTLQGISLTSLTCGFVKQIHSTGNVIKDLIGKQKCQRRENFCRETPFLLMSKYEERDENLNKIIHVLMKWLYKV